jgi:hypothetical protein
MQAEDGAGTTFIPISCGRVTNVLIISRQNFTFKRIFQLNSDDRSNYLGICAFKSQL